MSNVTLSPISDTGVKSFTSHYEKIEFSIGRKIAVFAMNFFSLGINNWYQSNKFEKALINNNISLAKEALLLGATPKLDRLAIRELIKQKKIDPIRFLTAQNVFNKNVPDLSSSAAEEILACRDDIINNQSLGDVYKETFEQEPTEEDLQLIFDSKALNEVSKTVLCHVSNVLWHGSYSVPGGIVEGESEYVDKGYHRAILGEKIDKDAPRGFSYSGNKPYIRPGCDGSRDDYWDGKNYRYMIHINSDKYVIFDNENVSGNWGYAGNYKY